jgi:hypothetical protein
LSVENVTIKKIFLAKNQKHPVILTQTVYIQLLVLKNNQKSSFLPANWPEIALNRDHNIDHRVYIGWLTCIKQKGHLLCG